MSNILVEEKVLSDKLQGIVSTVESLTVLELADLVKALEDKFGVVAAGPMMVAGVAAPAVVEDAGPDTVSVILKDCGDKKIQILKVVREITGLGLKEAKELVDTVPKAVKEDLAKDEAEKIKKQLEEQGAVVELK
jgi:large subunit ribosomal protein L7/L12